MIDTPRTDAFEALTERPINWWDFARELERENAALRAEVNVTRKNYEDYKTDNIALREQLINVTSELTVTKVNALADKERLEGEKTALRSALDQQANYQRDLRADRDRLDWLEVGCSCDLSWVGKEAPLSALTSLRKAIDWARDEEQS